MRRRGGRRLQQGEGITQGQRNKHTEHLGQMAGDEYMKEAYPNARKLDLPGEGPGTFDQVWHNPDGQPEFIIVECKGGSATNSSSRLVEEVRVQQGHQNYAEDIIENMLRNDKLHPAIRQELMLLNDAIRFSDVCYLEIAQRLVDDELGDMVVRKYL